MTRYNLPPADDPSSIESFLRVRRSQLSGGRPPIRGTREEAERRSAEHDAERILDLLARLPVDLYLEGETNGNRREVRYRWLRHHGYERRRLDAALAAAREQLARRVHVATDPITAAGGGPSRPAELAPGGRPIGTSPPPAAAPPAVVASASEGRSLVADDLTALTGGAGPQRASGFSLRHFAGEWWLCRSVDGRWTNTGYAARAGRWWRWANGTLVETRIPAPWPSRRGRYGLTASAAGSTSETALGVVQPDPGKYGRPTGGAGTGNAGFGPRVAARPGRPGTGGGAGRVVVDTGADRPVLRATGGARRG